MKTNKKNLHDAVELAHEAIRDVVTVANALGDKTAITHGLRAKLEIINLRSAEAISADEADMGIDK